VSWLFEVIVVADHLANVNSLTLKTIDNWLIVSKNVEEIVAIDGIPCCFPTNLPNPIAGGVCR
jgi:hypothetical protein